MTTASGWSDDTGKKGFIKNSTSEKDVKLFILLFLWEVGIVC